MKIEMKMPDLATTESEIKITQWLVEVGQPIKRGEPLLEVETDKAAVEVESFATGVLTEILAEPEDEVDAGAVIAIIEIEGSSPLPEAAEQEEPAAKQERPAPAAPRKKGESMFARNRRAAQQAPGRKQEIELNVAQRTTAKRMLRSKQTVPHFYLETSANAERMVARRSSASTRIVWDAFFVSAAAKALERFERMCYSFENEKLASRGTDAVGVAVDLAGELFVIPIGGAAAKSPEQISDEITATVERLRAGDTKAMEIRPANITVTNLGVANIERFVAIVNPPESAVLAIGRIAPVPAVSDGQIIAQNRVSLTLSVDHRVTGGRYAADFLDAIVKELESI